MQWTRLARAAVAVVVTVVLLFPAVSLFAPPDVLTQLLVVLVTALVGLPVANVVDRYDVSLRLMGFAVLVFWVAVVAAAAGSVVVLAVVGDAYAVVVQVLALAAAYAVTAFMTRRASGRL
ncbi:MAG: hypothetical protein ABEJ70_05410 [Halobacteriaceae archaeon]